MYIKYLAKQDSVSINCVSGLRTDFMTKNLLLEVSQKVATDGFKVLRVSVTDINTAPKIIVAII